MAVGKKNLGKDFEVKIKECLNKPELSFSLDRLPDPLGGYIGVRNISDYQGYKFPFLYYLECKCTYGNTLNFKSNITDDQWEGLTEKSKIFGVLAGFCIWFIDYDKTIFVPIQEMNKLRFIDNKKSVNIKDVIDNSFKYFNIDGKKKRIYFDYFTDEFITNLDNMCKDYWNIDIVEVKFRNE